MPLAGLQAPPEPETRTMTETFVERGLEVWVSADLVPNANVTLGQSWVHLCYDPDELEWWKINPHGDLEIGKYRRDTEPRYDENNQYIEEVYVSKPYTIIVWKAGFYANVVETETERTIEYDIPVPASEYKYEPEPEYVPEQWSQAQADPEPVPEPTRNLPAPITSVTGTPLTAMQRERWAYLEPSDFEQPDLPDLTHGAAVDQTDLLHDPKLSDLEWYKRTRGMPAVDSGTVNAVRSTTTEHRMYHRTDTSEREIVQRSSHTETVRRQLRREPITSIPAAWTPRGTSTGQPDATRLDLNLDFDAGDEPAPRRSSTSGRRSGRRK